MKGVINKGIQELVESRFGAEAWSTIKEHAGCEEPFFVITEDYPDEMSVALARSASKVSGLSIEDVLFEFGKFWVTNTGRNCYPTFYKMAGTSAREFLLNMDRVHDLATKSISNAVPPKFRYEELPDGRLLMHYDSKRNLCAAFRGLITGVGLFFNEDLEVNEIACVNQGAPCCTMEIIFP